MPSKQELGADQQTRKTAHPRSYLRLTAYQEKSDSTQACIRILGGGGGVRELILFLIIKK